MLRVLPVSSLLCALSICAPALAANQGVTATAGDQFSPPTVTIAPGEMVTWTNAGMDHNVSFEDGSFTMPSSPSSSSWVVSRTFPTAGSFKYLCQFHGTSMSGTVVVATAGGAPPPGGGGAGTTPGDPRPVSSLSSASRQDIDRLFVRASMNEAGTLTATATVKVPGAVAKVLRFKKVSRAVGANTTAKLRLKLAKQNLRAVKRALRTRKLKAKVAVTAKDGAGQSSVRRQTIRLSR